MNERISETSIWLESNEPMFIQAADLADQIREQNQLYSDVVEEGKITLKPFQVLAVDHLYNKQEESLSSLKDIVDQADYEGLGARDLEICMALGEIAHKLISIEEQAKEKTELIHTEEQFIADRLPELASELSELAHKMEAETIIAAKSSLEAERDDLLAEYEAVQAAYADYGRAWPVPKIIYSQQNRENGFRTQAQGDNEPVDVLVVDDFPDNPRRTQEQVAESVRRNHPEAHLRDASEFLALLLAEETGYIYTHDDLAKHIYGLKEGSRSSQSRVSALISGFELGKVDVIGRTLTTYGLVFQRGLRSSYSRSTGKKVGRSVPVFRAISIEEAEALERIVHSDETFDWVNDGWHTIVYKPTPRKQFAKEQNGADQKPLDLPPVSAESQPVAEPHLEDEPEIVDITESAESEQMPASPARKEKQVPEWQIQLKKDVGEAINQFEVDGLMVEGEISWKTVKIKSSSSIMGTKTMAARAVNNRLIPESASNPESELPISLFICFSLQNRYAEIFSSRSRRKQALAIIDDSVAKYFEKLKANQ